MKEQAIIHELPGYRDLRRALETRGTPYLAVGLSGIHKANLIAALIGETERPALVIAPNELTAARMVEDLNAFLGEDSATLYPQRELAFFDVEGVSREFEHVRLRVLGGIQSGGAAVVVASAEAALQHTIPPAVLAERTFRLAPGQKLPLAELEARLVTAGYSRSAQVDGLCQFSVRGGILDFSPPDSAYPIRLEYWDDEIDTISAFDLTTQRRIDTMKQVSVTPSREALFASPAQFAKLLAKTAEGLKGKHGKLAAGKIHEDIARLESGLILENLDRYLPLLYPEPATLFSYCGNRILFVLEPLSIKEAMRGAEKIHTEDIKLHFEQGVLFKGCDTFSEDFPDLLGHIQGMPSLLLDTFARSLPELPLRGMCSVNAIQLSSWSGGYSLLMEDLQSYLARGYRVQILAGTRRACDALLADLTRDGISAGFSESISVLSSSRVTIAEGTLSAGFEYPELKLAVITHSKTAAPARRKHRKSDTRGKKLKSLADLSVGDHVVHVSHGIGVFEGIIKREIHGVTKDYIKIRYAGTDTLFVPVTQLDLVSKYIGAGESSAVRLNKLNSVEWQKTRQRVKGAVKEMARELIQIYSQRLTAKGHPFGPDSEWQRDFEERFPYEETDDQLRCIDEIKGDMEKPVPMDRLLCGDVGFGKTEVALRAAFKCVMDGKQCAVLVPTTILAWQHYQTFLQRVEGFPVKVELLSRFRTPKEQAQVIRELKRGEADIVIGTHRLVQKDVQFKDLGLCIIDEEQRFGVAHKEKFKELRSSVDVLTLSATPIPRTLNMAMSGIRDMSTIEEAPQDRHPVQTYVLEHDWNVLADAIGRELRRGGQVYYLHNNTESIESCAFRLKELLPEARIVTAHGKMGEESLSRVWQQLLDQEIDILVCTTIIETGVDVANCNTLVIEDADRMGLSQLYQLRGRVGRSSRRAYAYFTFHKGKILSEIATKRLAAIREFASFGSGFRIAMRDLEIRGAGNILGAQQHGHMESVGYDLYVKLLNEAVSEEKGETPQPTFTEALVDIRTEAHIPEGYIQNLNQRLDVYKKIASIQSEEDAMDILDELIDRFGEPPASVKGLVDVAQLRNSAAMMGIKEISQQQDKVLLFPENVDMERSASLAAGLRGRVMLSLGAKPYITVRMAKGQTPVDTIREALAAMGDTGTEAALPPS